MKKFKLLVILVIASGISIAGCKKEGKKGDVVTTTYTLNATATNGTVTRNPSLAAYNSGATVQLIASPNSGYTFESWSGDATGSTNPLLVTMNANKNITANFIALVVNVKSKGATGNGSTDDTAAIQAAVDEVAGTDGTVLVPAGTYMIDATTGPNNNVGVKLGNSMTFRMESGAVLKAIPNSEPGYYILFLEGKSNVNVVGGTLQGERYQHTYGPGLNAFGMGLFIAAGSHVYVKGVTVKDVIGDGFFVGYGSSNITIDSVNCNNNRRQGLSICSVDGIVVQNSIFSNTNGTSPADGIDIETEVGGVNNVLIQNCSFINNEEGIRSTDGEGVPTNVIIQNNICNNNRYGGIDITPSGIGEIVRGNTCNGNRIGIWLGNNGPWATTGNSVTGNTVNNNATYGILISDGATGNTITGNTATGNPSGNIRDQVGGNTISGNTIN